MRRSTHVALGLVLTVAITGLTQVDLRRYESFEDYAAGTTDLAYWEEQNCRNNPCAECVTAKPVEVISTVKRCGDNALRMVRRPDEGALTGGSYCGYRNEISGHKDAFAEVGSDVWVGFSIYFDDYLKDKWSADNVHIFQFKNVDAGGGGNQRGSTITHKVDGDYYFRVDGIGDVAKVKLKEWIDIVLHIHYKISGGTVEAWIGSVHRKATVDFPDKKECYLKFGTYSDNAENTHSVYYDEIHFLSGATPGDHHERVAVGCQVVENSVARRGHLSPARMPSATVVDLRGRSVGRYVRASPRAGQPSGNAGLFRPLPASPAVYCRVGVVFR